MIGAELDFLGEAAGADGWSLPQFLNYMLLGRLRPSRRAAVVGAMRDDGIYIMEWVAHYLALDFDHIFIYTNDNVDGSETLLRTLADHRIITLIEVETAGTVPPEGKAFEHSIHLLQELRDFEWVLFVDSDEYLAPAARFNQSIATLLTALSQRFRQRLPSAICYHWLWYVSGMIYERRPGILLERFSHAGPHWLMKSLVHLDDVVSMRQQHFPEIKPGGFLVDSSFKPLNAGTLWERHKPQYDGGRINHYWARSFEEFSVKKARAAPRCGLSTTTTIAISAYSSNGMPPRRHRTVIRRTLHSSLRSRLR